MHHQEESLLERITYGVRLHEDEPKVVLDLLGHRQRMKNTPANFDDGGTQAAGRVRVCEEVF